MGNTGSSSAKAHAQALNWEEDSVPEGAWVVSVWLEVGCKMDYWLNFFYHSKRDKCYLCLAP